MKDKKGKKRQSIGRRFAQPSAHHSELLATVNLNFIALAFLLQGLGKHQLAHPINALVLVLDSKVMRLAITGHSFPAAHGGTGASASIAIRHKLECKRRRISSPLTISPDMQALECGA